MFRGRFEHSLDDKSRLAVPSRFRDILLDKSSAATLVVTNFDRCLVAYSLADWEDLERRVDALPQFDPKVVAFTRYFISGASECPLDKAGRILLPSNLRQLAGIERDCVIAGQLRKFEIWSADRWASMFGEASEKFLNMSAAMAELGLAL